MDRPRNRKPERADAPLGVCSNCEETIPRANLLIRYETGDDGPRMFAECPDCKLPVHPE